jgi:hypothetical protein
MHDDCGGNDYGDDPQEHGDYYHDTPVYTHLAGHFGIHPGMFANPIEFC